MKHHVVPENIRLKQALRESEASRQILLDSSLDCIVCTDAQARITEFNSAAERVFRIPRSVALGQDLPSLLFPASQATHRLELFGALSANGVELIGNRLEIIAMRSDGHEFPVEFTVTRVLLKEQLTSPGNYIALSVRDNGCGMDSENQIPFVRAFLHHERTGQRHRSRLGHSLRNCETEHGAYCCPERAKSRYNVQDLSPASK